MEGREGIHKVIFKSKVKIDKHFPSTFPGMGSQTVLTQKRPVCSLGATDIITHHTAECLFQACGDSG